MADTKIYTNNHWRPFKYRNEVPDKVLENDFDYLDEEHGGDDQFIHYRGTWYHTSDFMRLDGTSPFPGNWQGCAGDSYFSGVLIEISEDGEAYKIATYIS